MRMLDLFVNVARPRNVFTLIVVLQFAALIVAPTNIYINEFVHDVTMFCVGLLGTQFFNGDIKFHP